MKLIFATFALFMLVACGGGGGGNAPDTTIGSGDTTTGDDDTTTGGGDTSPTVSCDTANNEFQTVHGCVCGFGYSRNAADMCVILLTQAEQAQVIREVSGLRYEARGNAELLRRITQLENDIAGFRRTLPELRREIARLRADLPEPCTDFRERDAAGDCTYDAPEFRRQWLRGMGALYAYERGYHGQGVTVVNAERVLASHEDLRENVLTMDIGLNCRNLDVGSGRYAEQDRQAYQMYNCDRLAVHTSVILTEIYKITNTVGSSHYHGTSTAGLIVGARNGIEAHGVAPRAKLVPIAGMGAFRRSDDTSDLQWIADNDIPIVSYSTFYGGPFSLFLDHYRLFADTDTVHVFASGNNGPAWRLTQRAQTTVPAYERDLEDNWLVAGAVDYSEESIFVPCGETMMWCIVAFGTGGTRSVPAGPNNDDYTDFGGTSQSTPFVSGALAVLKSAAPMLPITVIRPILLTTATDLCGREIGGNCKDGVDPVYGWGLVNISAGIRHIEELKTQNGVLLRDLRTQLPSEFSHVRGRLDSVSVAVRITDGAYHNVALSEIVRSGGVNSGVLPANAAKEMAAADYAAGESFRFWGGLDYDGGKSSFVGAGDTIFAASQTSDTSGWIRWTTADYGGMSAFGEWQHTQINADYDSAAFISGIENARADGWTAGFRYADLFMHNDALQISARQESRLSGGEMVLHYPVAAGDFYEAFLGESEQTIRTEEARIPLKRKAETIWTAGYSQRTDGGDWTAAMEWNAATNAKALSAEWRIRF